MPITSRLRLRTLFLVSCALAPFGGQALSRADVVGDPQFGSGGIAIDSGTPASVFIKPGDVVGLPGGKVGWGGQGFGTTFVIRFDATGQIDTEYGTGGRLQQALPGTLESLAFAGVDLGAASGSRS